VRPLRQRFSKTAALLLALVPVNADVVRLPPDGDDVDAAVAVQIRNGEVLHRHPAVLDNLPLPLAVLQVSGLVDAHPATLAGLLAPVVADADDQLLHAVAVNVGTPDRVAPAQPVVDDVPVPQRLRIARRRVGDHLMAVPRLDGGDVGKAVLELAAFDLAAAAV